MHATCMHTQKSKKNILFSVKNLLTLETFYVVCLVQLSLRISSDPLLYWPVLIGVVS